MYICDLDLVYIAIFLFRMARLKYIKSLRWGFGTNIPQEIQSNMSENESKWFETYNGLLFNYMKNVSEDGIDLCQEQDPPKFRFITVSSPAMERERCCKTGEAVSITCLQSSVDKLFDIHPMFHSSYGCADQDVKQMKFTSIQSFSGARWINQIEHAFEV